jgi:hypothetical protein
MKKHKLICKKCGKTRNLKYLNKSELCVKCAANVRKNCLKKENSIQRTGRNRKAKIFKCPICGIEKMVRVDHKNKTGLCQKCSARQLLLPKLTGGITHTSYKNGIAIYQRETFKRKEKICEICKSKGYIIVHHIDGNRKNNKPENHLVLCNSCHCLLHARLRKGLSYKEIIEELNLKKDKFKRRITYINK